MLPKFIDEFHCCLKSEYNKSYLKIYVLVCRHLMNNLLITRQSETCFEQSWYMKLRGLFYIQQVLL